MSAYPNLELLEYKALEHLAQGQQFSERFKKEKEKNKWARLEFDVIVFSQTWGSTNTGFDVMEDGSPAWGGDAMTKEYTTIFHELVTDTYVVFFGNKPCYAVYDPPSIFFEDLYDRNMASLSEAREKY